MGGPYFIHKTHCHSLSSTELYSGIGGGGDMNTSWGGDMNTRATVFYTQDTLSRPLLQNCIVA